MATKKNKKDDGFSDIERAAMKERAKELKAEAKAQKNREEGERDIFVKIEEMDEADRSMATRIHEIVTETAPELMPKTWYGMPAYAKDGKVLCFFQAGGKFDARYSTFGFNDVANLDDGNMWPASFALIALDAEAEKRIIKLVKQAIS